MKNFFVLFFLSTFCIKQSITVDHDLTLEPFAVGTEVVDACIQKIVQQDIFPYDQQLLQRIWFTESGFVYNNLSYGGNWQISPLRFNQTNPPWIDFMIIDKIKDVFDIDWNAIQWEDLTVPFYSALAARMFVHIAGGDLILSSDLDSQAKFWADEYTNKTYPKTFFIVSVNFMSENRIIRNFGLDIIYIVGLSNVNRFSMLVKQLLVNLTATFRIDESSTRIGFISDGHDESFWMFSLNRYSNLSSIVPAIYGATLKNLSNTSWINIALNYSYSQGFSENNGARNLIEGIPQAIIVITDMIIDVSAVKDNNNISTFILGLGDNITSSDVQMFTSSKQVLARLSINANLHELIEFQEAVSSDLERASASIPVGITSSSELLPSQKKFIEYPLFEDGLTIKVDIKRNNSRIYISNWIHNPNSAAYDIMFSGPIKIEQYLNISILNSSLGSNRLFITIENNNQNQTVAFAITAKKGNDLGVLPKLETFLIEAINQVISIKCVVTGNPIPTIRFFREDTELISGNRIKIFYKPSYNATTAEATLQMSSLRQDDEGTYSCTGSVEFFNGSVFNVTTKQEVVVVGVLGGSLEYTPVDLKADIVDIGVAKVSWALPKHIAKDVIIGFRLFYKSSGINCTDEQEQPVDWTILDTNQTYMTLDDLQEGCTYEFMVQSETAEGYSANSKNISILIDFSEIIRFIPDNGLTSIAMLVASCALLVFISIIMGILLVGYGTTVITMVKRMRQKVSDDLEDLQELTDRALDVDRQ